MEIFTVYSEIVVVLSMIGLLMSFWTLPSIWFPMFDFMQVLFAVFLLNVSLPPTAMLALAEFKNSMFTFLPNFFSSSLPTVFYDKNVLNNSAYSIVRDFVFLRTMGHLYFILIVLGVLLGVTYLIGKKFFYKKVKKWARVFIR